jgi:hypothetical protein
LRVAVSEVDSELAHHVDHFWMHMVGWVRAA